MRNSVEYPLALPGPDIEGSDVSRIRLSRAFPDTAAENEQVFVDDPGAARVVASRDAVMVEILGQIKTPTVSETGDRFPGIGIEAVVAVGDSVEDSSVVAVFPIHNSSRFSCGSGALVGVERPDRLCGIGFDRDDLLPHGGEVEDAVHHQRIELQSRVLAFNKVGHTESPDELEPIHVAGVDLVQLGVFRAAYVSIVVAPFLRGVRRPVTRFTSKQSDGERK